MRPGATWYRRLEDREASPSSSRWDKSAATRYARRAQTRRAAMRLRASCRRALRTDRKPRCRCGRRVHPRSLSGATPWGRARSAHALTRVGPSLCRKAHRRTSRQRSSCEHGGPSWLRLSRGHIAHRLSSPTRRLPVLHPVLQILRHTLRELAGRLCREPRRTRTG